MKSRQILVLVIFFYIFLFSSIISVKANVPNQYKIGVKPGDEIVWEVKSLDEDLFNKSTGLNKEDLYNFGKVGAKSRIIIDKIIDDKHNFLITCDLWTFTTYIFNILPDVENNYLFVPKNPRQLHYNYYYFYIYSFYSYPILPFPLSDYLLSALKGRANFTVANDSFNIFQSSYYGNPFYLEYSYENTTGIMKSLKFVSMKGVIFYEIALVYDNIIEIVSSPDFLVFFGIAAIYSIGIINLIVKKSIIKTIINLIKKISIIKSIINLIKQKSIIKSKINVKNTQSAEQT